MISSNVQRRKRKHRNSQTIQPQLCIRCMSGQNINEQVWQYSRTHLYSKYCSSQNFYWVKDINDLLEPLSTSNTIKIRDLAYLDRPQQHLKSYNSKRTQTKHLLHSYCEYYRYYNTNPQFFMKPACGLLRTYIERKKMLLYRLIMAKDDKDAKDSDSFKSTKNQDSSSNKILEYAAVTKKSRERKKGENNSNNKDNSFEQMSKLKEKLVKIIKVFEKSSSKVKMQLPEATSLGSFLDGTVSQLSAIKPAPNFESEHQYYDNYGLTKFKDQFEKKRRIKKSQLICPSEYCRPKQKSQQKKLERANSLVKFGKSSKRKGSQTSSRSKTHKRTVSSESVLKSPLRFHKYTASNKC